MAPRRSDPNLAVAPVNPPKTVTRSSAAPPPPPSIVRTCVLGPPPSVMAVALLGSCPPAYPKAGWKRTECFSAQEWLNCSASGRMGQIHGKRVAISIVLAAAAALASRSATAGLLAALAFNATYHAVLASTFRNTTWESLRAARAGEV